MTKISFINKDFVQQGVSLCGSVLFNVRRLAIKSVTVFQNSFPPSRFGKWSHYLVETFLDNHRKIGQKTYFCHKYQEHATSIQNHFFLKLEGGKEFWKTVTLFMANFLTLNKTDPHKLAPCCSQSLLIKLIFSRISLVIQILKPTYLTLSFR